MNLINIGGVSVIFDDDVVEWASGMAVDADGAPNAYGPNNSGLDYTANAGKPGDWYGVVTDSSGEPVVQGDSDPCPGMFVSTTALDESDKAATDPTRYVDATKVPYISIPPEIIHACGVRKGDVAIVSCGDQASPAIVADVGPRGTIGEGSVALAVALNIPPSPRHGGVSLGVRYKIFKGSRQGWPRSNQSIAAQVATLCGMF